MPKKTYAQKNRYLRDDLEAILRGHRYPETLADDILEMLSNWEVNKDNA